MILESYFLFGEAALINGVFIQLKGEKTFLKGIIARRL